MGKIHVLSVAYDGWVPNKSRRGEWRVRVADKLLEEVLKHTPDAYVTRMHNNDARYDSIRSYLDRVVGLMSSNDIFWFQYNGHGSNLVRYNPIDLIDSWDGKGELPFTGENVLMDRNEMLDRLSKIGGLKFIVMDSCCSDIDREPPVDTIYVAAAASNVKSHGDLSTGVVHPTLSKYSIPTIVSNGAYERWNGLEFEFGSKCIVRANIVSPHFRVNQQNELPHCTSAQEFYERTTGETGKIMERFLPRTVLDKKIYELFEKCLRPSQNN